MLRNRRINFQKLLIIDLDDTLIDTKGFKKILFVQISEETGITFNKVEENYEKLRKNSQLSKGWPERFAENLSKISLLDRRKILDLIFNLVKKIHIHVSLLNYINNFPGYKILLTYGDNKLQKAKINDLKLQKYFNKVITISENKDVYLIRLIVNNAIKISGNSFKEVIILDDKVELLEKLKIYPWISIIHPKDIG